MSSIEDIVTDTKSARSTLAKQTLSAFVITINKHLETYFSSELAHPFGVSQKEKELTKHMMTHIAEHALRPAKRLRGSLVYYGARLLGNDIKLEAAALRAAMGIELIHTALLMHDDFMDGDDTRRAQPTTHRYYEEYHKKNQFRFDRKHYGESMAVNAGDVALCLGYELISTIDYSQPRVLHALSRLFRGIANTAYGQAYDCTLEVAGNADEDDIINLHNAKTAIYTYENPLHIGAILAGADTDALALLSKYAIPAGIAFQLQDDILGLFGNPKKTGKPAHSDLRQGKMTLLIVKAMEKASPSEKKTLEKIWGNRMLTSKDAEIVREIVRSTGSLVYSRETARNWALTALKSIPVMQKKGWNAEVVEYLAGIASYMIEREV